MATFTMLPVFAAGRSGLIALVALSLCLPLAPLQAQTNLRNSFPGRRIGGGTRGECSARLLAHLVPSSSVFAPGKGGTIGLLEGPTAQPRPLQLSFRPLSSAGTAATAQARTSTRDLAANPAGVVLLSLPPITTPTVWESGYRCDEGGAAGSDPLDFVQSASPPAVSLLVADAQSDDQRVAAALKRLRQACGATVPAAEVVAAFGLADVITPQWPQRLPVRCP
jgi:hypothetical protein